jgi:hypothetical protein
MPEAVASQVISQIFAIILLLAAIGILLWIVISFWIAVWAGLKVEQNTINNNLDGLVSKKGK